MLLNGAIVTALLAYRPVANLMKDRRLVSPANAYGLLRRLSPETNETSGSRI